LKCEGLTLAELQDKIAEACGEYFLSPQVTVGFAYVAGSEMPSPWGTVYVSGAVGRSGDVNIPPTRDLTVTRALMFSGGITPLGNDRKVWVSQRQKDGSIKQTKVNVKKIAERGRRDLDVRLKAGDVIYVPETWY
jgi:protein involved in polysaccharide export with SLBB domain